MTKFPGFLMLDSSLTYQYTHVVVCGLTIHNFWFSVHYVENDEPPCISPNKDLQFSAVFLKIQVFWDVTPCELVNSYQHILVSTTNKMQCYTIFFITVNALHVSGGFSTHDQELKNYTHSICVLQLNQASGSNKQAWQVPDTVRTVRAPDDGWRKCPKHVEHWQ
jgi:hypothetical protein